MHLDMPKCFTFVICANEDAYGPLGTQFAGALSTTVLVLLVLLTFLSLCIQSVQECHSQSSSSSFVACEQQWQQQQQQDLLKVNKLSALGAYQHALDKTMLNQT
jgi:hypothetical protein